MSTNTLTYSKTGLTLTQQFESCRLTAYQDQVGVWTIGYGHTGPEVQCNLTISLDQAEALLVSDVAGACDCVNDAVDVALAQNQFDALVDFVFNLGPHAFRESTLLKELNAGDMAAAAGQFLCWDHCGPAVIAGLERRRQAERDLFAGAAASPEPAAATASA